jgi:predicted O-methyltransferase YrrM
MPNKLHTLLWFAKRPQYWSHALDLAQSKLKQDREHERPQSTEWAKKKAIAPENAAKALNIDWTCSVQEKYPTIFKEAKKVENDCPIEMGGEGALSLLHELARKAPEGNIIETGVAYGWSSLALLLALDQQSNCKLFSIDLPYIQKDNDKWVGCVVPSQLRHKWELLRGSDRMLLKKILRRVRHISMAHYDSDKSYHGRKWAYPLLWEALAAEGYFISDDIQDNFAFKEFCDDLGKEPIIIEHLGKYVGILQKTEST